MTIEINKDRLKDIVDSLKLTGEAKINNFGTFKAKRYKTKLQSFKTKELVEYDSVKLHFVAHPKFKKRIK